MFHIADPKKLPSKKAKKRSGKKKIAPKGKKRKLSVKRSAKVTVESTYEKWLAKEQKIRKPARVVMKEAAGAKLPLDSREEWLGRQKVVEKETRPEVTPPEDTYAGWLGKQVSQRKARGEEEEKPVVAPSDTSKEEQTEQVELVQA